MLCVNKTNTIPEKKERVVFLASPRKLLPFSFRHCTFLVITCGTSITLLQNKVDTVPLLDGIAF